MCLFSRLGANNAPSALCVSFLAQACNASDIHAVEPSCVEMGDWSLPANYDSDLSELESACALHALFCELRHLMQLSHEDMASRTLVTQFDGRPCVEFITVGLVHDGCSTVCHNTHASLLPVYRYTGTCSIYEWLAGGGVFTICHRPKNGKHGWFSTTSSKWELTLQYAYPFPVESTAASLVCGRGTFYFRPVIRVLSYCWNSCGANTWEYTKLDCKRYGAYSVLFFPASACRDVAPIRPDA